MTNMLYLEKVDEVTVFLSSWITTLALLHKNLTNKAETIFNVRCCKTVHVSLLFRLLPSKINELIHLNVINLQMFHTLHLQRIRWGLDENSRRTKTKVTRDKIKRFSQSYLYSKLWQFRTQPLAVLQNITWFRHDVHRFSLGPSTFSSTCLPQVWGFFKTRLASPERRTRVGGCRGVKTAQARRTITKWRCPVDWKRQQSNWV